MLEVVIAMVLVGLFSIYFLHSSIRQLRKEGRGLVEFEFERARRVQMMKILCDSWPKKGGGVQPQKDSKTFTFTLNGCTYTSPKYAYILSAESTLSAFCLCLKETKGEKKNQEKKTYYFFANK